ncbi:Peptidyl-prolyl cis-trans isomerase [Chionoecetes opilio]|uniref:Peptidyl-prolyl cis-trans isomerase n=1 Tax=Chionoecetes opilio TaxID=41210 RepID=A0A8J4Z4P3_CHIOP|nr:Peptidyl-prolyl cis-trans isomerase [Chionoecetes opilio]
MSVARVLSPLRLAAPDKNGQTSSRTSMTEGLATPLLSVLTCGGCGRRFDDASHRPKFLSCFHTACLSCMRKDFSGGKVKCPTCNRKTEVKAADSLPDNTQLCTILLNMSSLNLHEAGSSTPARDTCPAHAARINFWCDTCRMPLCRDCTVLAHREAHGHKVRDHDQAVAVLRAEVRSSVGEARNLLQETRRLRHDQRKYLLRQLDAARAYEKQLKSELKSLDNDKKEDSRGLDRIETDSAQETSLVSLHEMAQRAGSVVSRLSRDLATAKAFLADSFLSLGKLHRSQDDLDSIDLKSSASGSGGGSCEGSPARSSVGEAGRSGASTPETRSPGSPARPCVDRRSQSLAGHYSSRRLAHNGRAGKVALLRPALSLEAAAPTIQPLPRVYLDLSIEGIQQTARVVIELRPDMAPRLCENFTLLCTGSRGFGYRGSQVFRSLPGWWLQGGDFQHNDGEGGRAALGDDEFISAETTDLEPRPGAVEMLCMSTNEEGRLMVGSQFFIHVKKYSYTHVFAYVIDGLDLVDKMTQLGDSAHVYRPTKTITIADCGLLAP